MNNKEEVEDYIKTQAVKHRAAEEGFQYDIIELDTFRIILSFALSEGFEIDKEIADAVMNGAADDDEFTTWHYMHEAMETMDGLDAEGMLPTETSELYRSWVREFWGGEEE
jgi:hypothetical protein